MFLFYKNHPDRLWCPTSPLFSGYQVLSWDNEFGAWS